jgi:hypothetical protein
MTSHDPNWKRAHQQALDQLHADRPVTSHLTNTGEQGEANAAYRHAQRTGHIADVRHQAHSVRGGSVPRHDADGTAGSHNASARQHTGAAGTANDIPHVPQTPPLTLRDELQMIAAKWARPTGRQRPGDRSAHQLHTLS